MNIIINAELVAKEVAQAIKELHEIEDVDLYFEKAMSYSKETIVFLMTKGLLLELIELEFRVDAAEIWEIFSEASV
jgi:hypothetical protein